MIPNETHLVTTRLHMSDTTALRFALDAFLHQPSSGKKGHDYEEFAVACVHIVDGGSVSPNVFVLRDMEAEVAAHAGMIALATDAANHSHKVYEFSAVVTGATMKSQAVVQLYTYGTTQYHDLPVRRALRKVSEVTIPLVAVSKGASLPMIILNAIDFQDIARASLTTKDARNLLLSLGADCVRGHVSAWVEGRTVPDRIHLFTEQELEAAANRLVVGHADFFAYYLSPYLRAEQTRGELAMLGMPEGKSRQIHAFMDQTYPNAVSMHAACTIMSTGTVFPSVESLTVVRAGRFKRSTLDSIILVALALMPPVFPDGKQVCLTDTRASKTAVSYISRLSSAIDAGDADVIMRFVLVCVKAACLIANMAAYDSDIRTTQRASTPSEVVNGMRMVGNVGESADCDGEARLAVEVLLSMRQTTGKTSYLSVLAGRALRIAYTPVLATAGAEGAQMRIRDEGPSLSSRGGFSETFVGHTALVSHAPAYLVRNDVLLAALAEADPAIADGFYATCDHHSGLDLDLLPPMFLAEGTAATHPCMYNPDILAKEVGGDRAKISGTGPGSLYSELVKETQGSPQTEEVVRGLRSAYWLSIHGEPRFGLGMATFVRVITQFGLPPFPYVSEDGTTRVASSFYLCQRKDGVTTAGVATPDIVFPDSHTTLVLKAHRTFVSKQEFETFRNEPMRVDGLPVFSRNIGVEGELALELVNAAIVKGTTSEVQKAALSLFTLLGERDDTGGKTNSTEVFLSSETARTCASRIGDLQKAFRDAGVVLVTAKKTLIRGQALAVSTGFLYNLNDRVIQDLVHSFASEYSAVSLTLVVYTSNGMCEVFVRPMATTT